MPQKNQPQKRKPRKSLVLAVSGGPDSMCLLAREAEAAQKDGQTCVVAHVNYGLRASSAGDAVFVQAWAARYGFPCEVRRISEEERLARRGNLEAWARDMRYTFFEEIRKHYGAEAILIAHTADDQAETVLMRLLQGTGLRGLAGMRAETGFLRRPLLTWRRRDILSYLQERGVPFRTDETNADVTLLRNRLRHEILPLLEQKDPRFVEKLCAVAQQAQVSLQELAKAQERWLAVHTSTQNGWLRVEKAALERTPQLLKHELLRHLAQLSGRQAREERELERFLTEAKNSSRRTLSNGLQIRLERGTVAFCLPDLPSSFRTSATIRKNAFYARPDPLQTAVYS